MHWFLCARQYMPTLSSLPALPSGTVHAVVPASPASTPPASAAAVIEASGMLGGVVETQALKVTSSADVATTIPLILRLAPESRRYHRVIALTMPCVVPKKTEGLTLRRDDDTSFQGAPHVGGVGPSRHDDRLEAGGRAGRRRTRPTSGGASREGRCLRQEPPAARGRSRPGVDRGEARGRRLGARGRAAPQRPSRDSRDRRAAARRGGVRLLRRPRPGRGVPVATRVDCLHRARDGDGHRGHSPGVRRGQPPQRRGGPGRREARHRAGLRAQGGQAQPALEPRAGASRGGRPKARGGAPHDGVRMRPVVVACALVPSLLAWGPAALADDDTSDLQSVLSSPVVSTASKTPEMDTVSPGTTTVVTGEDMMRYGMRTVGEAVNFLAMGVVGDSPQGLDADDFGARGVLVTGDLGAHFLVMIDGHTVNQPLGGTGEFYSSHAIGASFGPALGVPLELVDHIEVTLGPGSVLYGSNAMLGIVNVVTKRAAAFEGVHVAADSQLLTTGRVFAGGGHAFTLFGKPAEATAGFEYFTRKGPGIDIPVQVSGGGPYGGTAHDNSMQVPSGIARLRVGSLELSARATLKDASLPLPTGVFDDPKAHDLERRLSFEVSHRASISELLVVTSRAYFDTYDLRGTYEIFSNVSLPLTAAAYWGGAEVRGSFDWFGNGRFVTLVGAEGTYRQVGQLGLVELSGNPSQVTGHLDRHDVILAAYGEQTWRPRRWLALNAGLRLDYDERFPAVASPRVAASVKPWE